MKRFFLFCSINSGLLGGFACIEKIQLAVVFQYENRTFHIKWIRSVVQYLRFVCKYSHVSEMVFAFYGFFQKSFMEKL